MSEFDGLAIPRVSPTSAEDLLMCRARALRTGHGRQFVETPTLALGNSCHAVSEQVYKGQFDAISPHELRNVITAAFDEELERRTRGMVASAGGRDVPPPRRWKNYRQIRSRLPRFLASEVERRQAGQAPEPLAVEELLESHDGVIYGYPDRVERDINVVRVVDLKSGPARPEGVPDQYRRQLMVYAYLWQQSRGQWPDELAVQRVDGRFEKVDLVEEDIENLVDTIRDRRETANAAIAAGEAASDIANPSPVACQWCNRRSECIPFAESLDSTFTLGGVCVFGSVTNLIDGGQSSAIEVAISSSNLESDIDSIRILSIEPSTQVEIGQQVAAMDARETSTPDQITLNAWSTLSVLR